MSISSIRVARELDRLLHERGKPKTIVSDNGTELTSNVILRWADDYKVAWHYIAPAKPVHHIGSGHCELSVSRFMDIETFKTARTANV